MKRLIAVAALILFTVVCARAQNSNSVTVTVVAPPTWTITVSPGNYYQARAATMTITVTVGVVVNTCTATWDSTALPLTFPSPIPANPVTLTAAVSSAMTATLGAHTVLVTCPVPVLTMNSPVTLPNGILGQSYSASLASLANVKGGLPPYTWSLDPATPLPPGLSLSSSGVVSGVASGTGCSSCSFGFTVTDSSILASHSTALTWVASIGGSIPAATVAGYNIYRGDQLGGPTRSSTLRSFRR